MTTSRINAYTSAAIFVSWYLSSLHYSFLGDYKFSFFQGALLLTVGVLLAQLLIGGIIATFLTILDDHLDTGNVFLICGAFVSPVIAFVVYPYIAYFVIENI